jgi:hypothetical protein
VSAASSTSNGAPFMTCAYNWPVAPSVATTTTPVESVKRRASVSCGTAKFAATATRTVSPAPRALAESGDARPPHAATHAATSTTTVVRAGFATLRPTGTASTKPPRDAADMPTNLSPP